MEITGVIPDPAATATNEFCVVVSMFSGWFSSVISCLEMNCPMGLMTSRRSPALSDSLAQLENTPPRSRLMATRISPGVGSAQME
jgi:hypothetical protein